MDNHPDPFRHFPAQRKHFLRKKLYTPSHDLEFDLEMARRASRTADENPAGQDPQQSLPTEAVKSGSVEFGLISQHPAVDEETLEQLSTPPPLKYQPGLERELRPDAIFIYNRSIALLKTAQIISHILKLLLGRQTRFKHLEWVDDFSCVLVFASDADAIEAYAGLLIRPDEVEGENGLPEAFAYLSSTDSTVGVYNAAYEFVCTHRPAKPFSESLFEENPTNKFHCPSRPEQLIPFVRFATISDVKGSHAREESMFYAFNGDGAGQEGVLAKRAGKIFATSKLENTAPLGRPASPDQLHPDQPHPDQPHPDQPHPDQPHALPPHPPPPHRQPHPLPARPVHLPRQAKPLPQSQLNVTRSRPITLGKMDGELAPFMTKSIEVKPPTDRTNRKRERDEQVLEVAEATEDELVRSRKRRMPSPSAIKPSVELLPDRPKTSGGNLRDEIFENDHLMTDFQQAKPQLETKNEGALRMDEVEKLSTTDDMKPTERSQIPGPIVQEGYGDDNHKMGGVAKPAEHVAHQKQPSSDGRPARVPKPEPKSKGRWGPLFSRLY